VCTANQGRSPVAEVVARGLAPPTVEVSSCGVHATQGRPPLPEVIIAAAALGIDVSAHRAQPLERASTAGADLVVGFEPGHVAAAVVEGGTQRERAFTLTEVVWLLERARLGSRSQPAKLVSAAAERRNLERKPAQLILDPAGRTQPQVDRIVNEVTALTRRLTRLLFGVLT
jgi:protein-tyrosine-phosphatase